MSMHMDNVPPATTTYNLIHTLKTVYIKLLQSYCFAVSYSVFLFKFFCQSHRAFRKFLLLQGDMPTFCFEVLHHFWQVPVAYWLVTPIIERQMAAEA